MLKHFEAVEADFQSHYGLDLRQVCWGPGALGVRRIRALVRGLPIDGVTVRETELHGKPWSITDELLATLIELIDHGNRMYYSAHAKNPSGVWKPLKITRPIEEEDQPPERKISTVEDIKRFFGDGIVYQGSEN